MAADPSVVVEVDLENGIARVYNPLFPDMCIEGGSEFILDMKAIQGPDTENEIRNILREEYREKYGI
jgi:hypothetical protein